MAVSGIKQTVVGEFFEKVSHSLLGGELARDELGDLHILDISTNVEVKGSSVPSSYGFRLRTEQMAKYECQRGFPAENMWYAFYAYRNRRVKNRRGQSRTEMSDRRTGLKINEYLANSISWAFIVDFDLVLRWRDLLPHSTKSILGWPGVETVDLKPQFLYPFTNGGLEAGIRSLDRDPLDFRALDGLVKMVFTPSVMERYFLSFPIRMVIPHSQVRLVKRYLKKKGLDLS